MAWAPVAHAGGITNGTGTTATTSALNSTGANVGFVRVTYVNSGGDPTISDSNGHTWTQRKKQSSGADSVAIYSAPLSTVGAGHTATASLAGSFPDLSFAVFSGGAGFTLDQVNGANGAATTTQATGSVTPTTPNQLIISAVGATVSTNTVASIDSGQTLYDTTAADGNNFAGGLAYEVQTTATTRNPVFTVTQSSTVFACIATFKVSTTTNLTLTATQGQTATLATVKTKVSALSATQGQTATLGMVRMFIRTLTATQGQAATLGLKTIIPRKLTFTGSTDTSPSLTGRVSTAVSWTGSES